MVRSSRLAIIVILCAASWSGQTYAQDPAKISEVSQLVKLRPSIAAFYTRSAADKNSSQYSRTLGANFKLGAELFESGTISLETGLARDLEALEVRNIWSSTTLSYSSQKYKLLELYNVTYDLTGILPSNSDERLLLSYRGSLGLGLTVGRTFERTIGPVDQMTLSLVSSATRNMFAYDASLAGTPNKTVQIGQGLGFEWRMFETATIASSFALRKVLAANGSWSDPDYIAELSIEMPATQNVTLRLAQSTEDRAFSYDSQTTQIALYDQLRTVYTVTGTYKY